MPEKVVLQLYHALHYTQCLLQVIGRLVNDYKGVSVKLYILANVFFFILKYF